MSHTLDAPILVLADLDDAGRPTGTALELLAAARSLGPQAIALVLGEASAASAAAPALAAAGATRLLAAAVPALAGCAADALVSAARATGAVAVLVASDYRGKEIAGRAAVLLGSAAASDLADLRPAEGGDALTGTKLVLSGSWSTASALALGGPAPVIAVRPGAYEAASDGIAELAPETVEVAPAAESAAIELVEAERSAAAAGPELTEARTVVVGGRGVDGDFDLVRSLAEPLGAAVGATRVACDEGWIERSAQVGQTGVSVSPRLYIGLGVSGAVHHTSGIQGAQAIVAVCDDSEAPIFEMADFGVVGDVAEVVPQMVAELARLRG